ncbi:MAG: molybdenum cofactor guanylyltransferase [Limisphaerales bacterium]
MSAVIMAGGESERMGRNKAWLGVDDKPLLVVAVDKARALGIQEIFISGNAGEDYSTLNCPVLFDLEPGFGPLGGIERALHECSSPLLMVLAVDLPRMTISFLQRMLAHCDRFTGAVPKLKGEVEPLAAVYPKRCHVIAFDCVVKSRPAVRDFVETCLHEQAVRTLPVTGADPACFFNYNSSADISGVKTLSPASLKRLCS